jgi:hypothetical protein
MSKTVHDVGVRQARAEAGLVEEHPMKFSF